VSQPAPQGRRRALVVASVVALLAVVALTWWLVGGSDDEAEPLANPTREPSAAATTEAPTPSATPSTPEPTPTVTENCDGPGTQFNLEGLPIESLQPDCGTTVVTKEQQRERGLDLGCGGDYPIILFKTTTSDAKTSICGATSSGEKFRVVTKPQGGDVLDMPGDYDPQRDAFVAEKDGTEYTVLGYDGTLIVTKDGRTTTQAAKDWVSLDNEPDN
jgi:hypothetical protein